MKKVLHILSLLLVLFYMSAHISVSAQTIPSGCNRAFSALMCIGKTYCSTNYASNVYCCDQAIKCTQITSGGTPINTSAQDPTCPGGKAIDTAIGCIDFQDTNGFTGTILKWLVGVGGGIAFLLILSGAFTTMTSSGNPERLKQGQEIITAAVSGLILLIFSIFVLKLIGIDILGLGAFGFGQ